MYVYIYIYIYIYICSLAGLGHLAAKSPTGNYIHIANNNDHHSNTIYLILNKASIDNDNRGLGHRWAKSPVTDGLGPPDPNPRN